MALDHHDVERLIRAAEPAIRDAFIAVVLGVNSAVDLDRLIAAIRAADPAGAWAEIGMAPGDFNGVREAQRTAFRNGGEAEATANGWKFDMGAQGADEATNRRIGRLIREITDETRELVAERVARGIAEGTNPRRVALDLVGRRVFGAHTRTGGIVGLTRTQESWVQNAAAELVGDAPTRDYLRRDARDRRFDRSVRRAIREGRPVPADIRDKMIAAYRSRLLRVRGEAIGRTEALGAVNAGRHEALEQAVNDPNTPVDARDIRRQWFTTQDGRERDTHAAMNRQVRGYGQPFESPSGARLMHPGDTSLGAPASEIVGCRCSWTIRIAA